MGHYFWLIVLFPLMLSSTGFAGVMADIKTVLYDSGKETTVLGKFFVQENKIRLDQVVGGVAQSTLMDYPSQRAMILLHEPKLYFAFPLEDRFWWGRVTQGLVADLNKTYKEGYTVKLIREENFMGFDCRVTQASWQANGARQEVFFWLPHDLQGVSLKTQVSQDGHLKMEAQLSGIQKRDFEESFFQKPADYARALDQNTNFEEAGKAKSQ